MDTAKVIQVIETTILRRGSGSGPRSPVRVITQYWSLNGELLAEVDPCAEVVPCEAATIERCSADEVGQGELR